MFDFIIAERKSKCKLIIRHYLNIVAAMARTVELAEVHALPDTEDGLAVLDEHGLARADIAALEVRGRIALGMPKLPPVGLAGLLGPRSLLRPGIEVINS